MAEKEDPVGAMKSDPEAGNDQQQQQRSVANADANWATFVAGLETGKSGIPNHVANESFESGSARKSVHWSREAVTESSTMDNTNGRNPVLNGESSPYVSSSPASSINFKETMLSVRDTFGRWRKKVGEATKIAGDLSKNTWQHLKTSPSFTDAALGRIAQGTKVLAEGGYEKIFRQTFETEHEEQLVNSYACYLSTSAGPVMGTLYVSSTKLAFCSDNPIPYKTDAKPEWSYYKVVIPLHQLKTVNPSTNTENRAEKYIQVNSSDNHEFWYMGFLNYDGAVQSLQEILQTRNLECV